MKVREKIDQNIQATQRDIDLYERLNEQSGGDYADKIADLIAHKERLEKQAQHYDREAAAGYEKPSRFRQSNDSLDFWANDGLGKTLDLDNQE